MGPTSDVSFFPKPASLAELYPRKADSVQRLLLQTLMSSDERAKQAPLIFLGMRIVLLRMDHPRWMIAKKVFIPPTSAEEGFPAGGPGIHISLLFYSNSAPFSHHSMSSSE